MKNALIRMLASTLVAFLLAGVARADIYSFRGGVRIPAGSCVTYSNTRGTQFVSGAGGLAVYNMDGRIDASCVCQVPVPERARIRQFVLTGNVSKGEIKAQLGGVRWNVPRQSLLFAAANMLPVTPYEVPEMKQKKVVRNLPVSGPGSVKIDRIQTYFIEARFISDAALTIEEALEIFYFEIYWDQ